MSPARKYSPERRVAAAEIAAGLYCECHAELAEGPVWENGVLYWVDITGKALFTKPDNSSQATRHDLGIEVGSFAFFRDGRMLLATAAGIQAYEPASGQRESWSNPEPERSDNRFNDGKCDPRGRFVAGTMSRSGAPGQGGLYQVGHDRRVRKLVEGVSCSNGLAWSERGTTLYHIDTPTGIVRAYEYDLETGEVGASHVVVEIPPDRGVPDGMTIDRAGCLWIALWGGWAVECWDPASGRRLAQIHLPAAQVTSCTFGGENLDRLFITTARKGLDAQSLPAQPLAGSIFVAQPGVAGHAAVRFAGQ